jgi:S-adenosylmethionine synthetase
VVIAAQHNPDVDYDTLREAIVEKVIREVIPKEMLDKETQYFINTTGRFVIGGPLGDCGLTGRKIIMDTYGGFGYHGGGAFSGKDPSKVDRSASYMCRYIAKNIVAAGLAEKCEIQVAYTIGRALPVSVLVGAYSTGVISSQELTEIVKKEFDLRPAAIIERLDLLRPIYRKTCNYGHFGRELPEFTWEKTDMVDTLKKAVK